MPTGSPEDAIPRPAREAEEVEERRSPLEEARAGDPRELATWLEEASIDDVLDELDRLKPGDDVDDKDEHWAHVGRCMDVLDALFGNPDDIDLGPHPTKILPPGHGLSRLEESWDELEEFSLSGVTRLPYKATLHPRDRLGKWTEKLHAVRSFVAQHHAKLRGRIAGTVAAARLHHEVRRAHRPGRALHEEPGLAHKRADVEAGARLRSHAAEQRRRQGLSGAKQQAYHQGRRAKGHALYALAYVYSEQFSHQVSKKAGVSPEPWISDPAAVGDTIENAKTTKELAHEVTRYAVEHKEEIAGVLRLAGHAGRALARAKGLAAADVTAEDEEVAELTLAGVLDDRV
jgi:hypothetical protein